MVASCRGAFVSWRVNPDFIPFFTRSVLLTPARAYSL